MKPQTIIIILVVFIAKSFCFADEIKRVSFSLVGDQQSYIYRAGIDNYLFELENPNDNQNPTVWGSPLYISKKNSMDRCETESLLITDVFYYEKADMILIRSYSGSNSSIDFVDPQTGKNMYPRIEAFTEKIDVIGNQIEIYPGCECIDEREHSYQCTSAKVILFDSNFKPYIDAKASDELTKEIIGIVFKGDEKILFPKTKKAKVLRK